MCLLLTVSIWVGWEYRYVWPKLALGFFKQFLVFCSPIYLAYYSSFEMDKPEIYLNNRHFPPVKLQLYSGQTLSDYLSDKFCLSIMHILNKFLPNPSRMEKNGNQHQNQIIYNNISLKSIPRHLLSHNVRSFIFWVFRIKSYEFKSYK